MEAKVKDPAPGTVGLNEHGHLVDIGTAAKRKRRKALFEATPNPTCQMCLKVIDVEDDAVLFSPIDGNEYLVHVGPCFHDALVSSVFGYLDRGTA